MSILHPFILSLIFISITVLISISYYFYRVFISFPLNILLLGNLLPHLTRSKYFLFNLFLFILYNFIHDDLFLFIISLIFFTFFFLNNLITPHLNINLLNFSFKVLFFLLILILILFTLSFVCVFIGEFSLYWFYQF